MHMQQPPRTRALVQVVDILRDDQQFAIPCPVERGQRLMRRIGHDHIQRCAPQVIEAMHQRRIAP